MPLKAPTDFELDESEHLTRLSHEDAGSNNSDDTRISELDLLKPANGNGHAGQSYAWLDGSRRRSWLSTCLPSRFSCSLIAIFFVSILLILAAGRFWTVHKQKERHFEEDYGLSEAWYPTPAGGQDADWQESYRKAADLVKQMTLVEKVNITTGTGWSMDMCVGVTGSVERLGFPNLCLQDGPLGLRFVKDITAFPAGITVGATWNKRLMRLRGEALGFEARKKGINVQLGPAMGPIGRLPAGGRNWEGFGSDPVLQGIAAAETIKGIQSQGVIATAKHWVGNEQEHFRQAREWGTDEAISANIDDRTLHEIYAWPFADSVRAGVGSVMCAYNRVNNSYACQNSKLLNGVLKDELGFQGFVQSDWLAQRSGVASALAGLDMTMPGDGLIWQDGKSLWGSELTRAVLNTSIPIDRFNDMVMRVVAAWYQMKQDNKTMWPSAVDGGGPNFSSWTQEEHGKLHQGAEDSTDVGVVNKNIPVRKTDEGGDHDSLARRIASEGIVLLKNEGKVLPLARDGKGIRQSQQGKIKVGVFGEDAFLPPTDINGCADRGCNEGTLASGWGSGAVEFPYLSEPFAAIKSAFDGSKVELTASKDNNASDTQQIASQQDFCLVFVDSDAGEGYIRWHEVQADRPHLYAQKGGDELIARVIAGCGGDVVVVVHTVGPIIMERWIEESKVKAVLVAHLPGQESGRSLADVLFGYINPSGHLPYTIAKKEEDYGPHSHILVEQNHPITPQQNFTEGLYFDYRYFDKQEVAPRFEFGFGLSYTTFALSDFVVNSTNVNGTLPKKREYYKLKPPRLDHDLPDVSEALWPANFRKLSKYIYPYLDSKKDVQVGQYPWPEGYEKWHVPSAAGGGPGGNPDLYTTVLKLSVTLRNTGTVAGDAVIQAYVSLPSNSVDTSGEAVDVPVRVLRAFEKRTLGTDKKDSSMSVGLDLTRRDLSFWDVKEQNWVMPHGQYKICVGFSSRDLPECKTWTHRVYHPPTNSTTSATQHKTLRHADMHAGHHHF